MSKSAAAGIWQIIDVYTGEVYIKFRARKHADVTKQLDTVSIGLKKPIEHLEALRLTDWEE